MTKKIKIFIVLFLGLGVSTFIYGAAQLTKLRDSDILDVQFDDDEEEWF